MVQNFDIGQFVDALTEETVLNDMVARVKKKRKAMKISQKALAEQSGVNRPHSSLRNRYGKRVWQSPIQKREELLEQAREEKELYHIRFIKRSA